MKCLASGYLNSASQATGDQRHTALATHALTHQPGLSPGPLQTACPADSATGKTSRRKAPENPDMCQPPNRMPSRQSRGMLQASGEDLRLLRLELLLGE